MRFTPGPLFSLPISETASHHFDVIVVGGTPSGIAGAVRAAREGLRVLLTNHTAHLGGFMTSGAGGWEAPYDGIRSPLFDEVRRRITEHYASVYGRESAQCHASQPDPTTRSRLGRPRVEPRIAERIFEEMVGAEPNLTVQKSVIVQKAQREGKRLKSVTLQAHPGTQTAIVTADIFIDCTNEGDLLAAAGTAYHVGRESRSTYNESLAGVVYLQSKSHGRDPGYAACLTETKIRELGDPSGLEILPESSGEADPTVMSYNYRLILTKNPDNRVWVKRPANYDPAACGDPSVTRSIVTNLPNEKIGWNGGGRLIGPQAGYPEGSWQTRGKISLQYLEAAIGQLWYFQNDPAASAEDRAFWKDYGLALDEFPDNDHLPYEIYVREARRLIGQHVFTQHDFTPVDGMARPPIHSDSVAVTDWPCDSTACTPRRAGSAEDGKYMVLAQWRPAQVPYRSLLARDVENLLVPVCLSSSHVGWGTLRLEPVWMQTGEAAGFAAAQAVRAGILPSQIDPTELVRTLAGRGFMLTYFADLDPATHSPWNPESQDLAMDAALQFLGTRGYFPRFDARPEAPLSRQVAEKWIPLTARWLSGEPVDATAAAREIQAIDLDTDAPISMREFRELAESMAGIQLPLAEARLEEASISRGQAARWLSDQWRTA